MPRPSASVVSPRMTRSLERSSYYPDIVTIQRGAATRGPSGGVVTGSYATLYANIAARVSPGAGGEIRRPDSTIDVDSYTIELAGSFEDIRDTDRAVWGVIVFNILRVDRAPADERVRLIVERVH